MVGIPFRRGYLLHGVPGAGKTSLIHSVAGELGLPIYILSLTVLSLDDNTLKSLISARLPKSCIVLIEDIDAANSHIESNENTVISLPASESTSDAATPIGA